MGGRLRRHAKALADVGEAAVYVGWDDPDVPVRFLDAVERTMHLLAENPEVGPARSFGRSDLAGLRFFPVRGFSNHRIFSRATEHGIEVLRVLHGARDLGVIFDE